MDIKNRKWILMISAAAILMFLIVFFSNVAEVQEYERASRFRSNNSDCFGSNDTIGNAGRHGTPPVPISYRLFLSPALLMIAAIFATYYFISRRLEDKLEKNMNILSKLIDKNNPKESTEKVDNSTVLKFFNGSERKILEKLIENNGATLQSEISRMEGMNKLRTHRTLKDLERKEIIKIESHGKTNRIILSGDVKEILLKK